MGRVDVVAVVLGAVLVLGTGAALALALRGRAQRA